MIIQTVTRWVSNLVNDNLIVQRVDFYIFKLGPPSGVMLSPEMIAMHQAHLELLEMLGMSSHTFESHQPSSRPQSAIIVAHAPSSEQPESPTSLNQNIQSRSNIQDQSDNYNRQPPLIRSDSAPAQSRRSHREAVLTGVGVSFTRVLELEAYYDTPGYFNDSS